VSWRNIIKRELYPLASRKELARSPMVRQQMEDALSQVQIDEEYDACCENAMARTVDILERTGKLITSTGAALTGKEAADHVSEYNCDKLRLFIEETLARAKLTPEIMEEYEQILDDWKDCEGE